VGDRKNLTQGRTATLNGAGEAQIELEPGTGGTAPNWQVSSIITKTNRPGQAPIPRVEVFLNTITPENTLASYYDGSFGQATGDQTLSRGSKLIAVWTGGQAGDQATFVVNGEQWS